MSYLFRGVSDARHERSGGVLAPKTSNRFEYTFHWGEGLKWGAGTWGSSAENAVLRHQLGRAGFPTSGVSTTPHFDRACCYATHDGRNPGGYVYKIDPALFSRHEVTAYRVADYTDDPAVPDDDEVILVSADNGPLPKAIVVEVIPLGS